MQSHKLNNGLTIPNIGFGTWNILLNGRAKRSVIEALHAGYRLIDTAKIYGNERGVGDGIRESGIDRNNIFVTTKLWTSDQGYNNTFKAFDKSLSALGLDYIDLYLIHWPGSEKRLDSWRAMQEIYASGRSKAIGVSNYTIAHLEELADSKIIPTVNQIEFHPLIYNQQKAVLDYCRSKKIIVEAYSPLMRGRHLDNPVLDKIAKSHSKTNAQVVLRWCIQHDTVPIPKTTHSERIHENLDVFDFKLTGKEMSQINDLSNGTRTTWDPTNIN